MSKTYRINGKVVNDITLKGYIPNLEEYKNYYGNDEFGTINSPIFHKFNKTNFNDASSGTLICEFNDYGYAQIVLEVQSVSAIANGDGVFELRDENNNLIQSSFGFVSASPTLVLATITTELWGWVKPKTKLYYKTLGIFFTSVAFVKGYYRLHNVSYAKQYQNDANYSNVDLINQTAKQSNYIERKINIKEYNKEEGKWTSYKNENKNINSLVSSPEIFRYDKFSGLVGKIEHTFDKSGWCELFVNGTVFYEFTSELITELKDENGNLIKRNVVSHQHYKLTPAEETLMHQNGFKVKKGWKLSIWLVGVSGGKYIVYGFNSPNYKLIDDANITKETKTLMMNDKIVNELTIEEYDVKQQKWIPITTKNNVDLHTTPYVKGGDYTAILGKYIYYDIPTDGMLSVRLSVNALVEIAGTVFIEVYDENNNKVASKSGEYSIIAIRPNYLEYGTQLLNEVKKGWYVKIYVGGVSGGKVYHNIKIDTTYRLADDKGNIIESK